MTRRRWIAVALVAAALLLAGRAAAALYADYLWYAALDALPVWRVRTTGLITTRALAAAAWSLFLFANLFAVRRSVVSIRATRRLGDLEIGEEIAPRLLDLAAIGASVLLGVVLAFAHDDWSSMLLARHGIPFGEIEPYFELDLGYFVYWLPFETSLRDTALVAVLLVGALAIFIYALTPSLSRESGSLYVSQYVRRHLFVLLALLLLVLAWSYRLDAYHLLVDGGGQGGAFSYADHHGQVPSSIALSIIAVAAAALVLWAGWTGQLRIAFVTVGSVLLLAVALRQVAPWLARRSAPPAIQREQPYLTTRAIYTRRAYGADRIATSGAPGFTDAAALARGAPLWDTEALLRALERGDRGRIPAIGWRAHEDGSIVAVVPFAPGAPTADARPWRVARISGASADPRGEPVAMPSPDDAETPLPPPLVTDEDAPAITVADTADGVAAPVLGSLLSRLAHAWSLQDYRFLGDDLPRPRPRIVTHRDARDRVRRLAPIFTQGERLVPVVLGDTLYWVVELYATSRTYPLSEPQAVGGEETRYARHSATAVVNSQSGRVTIVSDPVGDPISRTWQRLVPGVFAPWSALPPGILEALPPPLDGALVQAAAFAEAGVRGASTPGGHLPRTDGADAMLSSGLPGLFALPSGNLAWSTSVLDDEDRVLGVVVAAGGRDRGTYWLPARGTPRSWTGVLDTLRRAGDSALTTRDARLARGPVRVYPLDGAIVYAQTAYATRPDGTPAASRAAVLAPPALLRTGPTLAAALGMETRADSAAASAGALTPAAFEARVRELYDEMRESIARGDWRAFGAAYDALGQLLRARRP